MNTCTKQTVIEKISTQNNQTPSQAKYFSEEYLNKEFDIFLDLASNNYLDQPYGKFLNFPIGASWPTHGNNGLFETSTMMGEMQIDNDAYNSYAKILVANQEVKRKLLEGFNFSLKQKKFMQ